MDLKNKTEIIVRSQLLVFVVLGQSGWVGDFTDLERQTLLQQNKRATGCQDYWMQLFTDTRCKRTPGVTTHKAEGQKLSATVRWSDRRGSEGRY